MKIGLQTWGTEGDVRPFLALAKGLTNAGHDVTLTVSEISGRSFTAEAESLGFPIRHVGRLGLSEEQIREMTSDMIFEGNPGKQLSMMLTKWFEPFVDDMLDAAKTLCAENDLVIGHWVVSPLKVAALRQRRPHVMIFLQPMSPSRYLPPIGVPDVGRWTYRAWWKIFDLLLAYLCKPSIDRLYHQEGLQPERSVAYDVWNSPLLNIVGSSPTLCPPPPDWQDRYHLCGFLSLPETTTSWQMPHELAKFMDAGEPPVYITFGSMLAYDPPLRDILSLVLEAIRLAGCRAIIQANWDDVPDLIVPAEVYRIVRAPHHDIFPRCRAVVHHGGAGTTQAATIAGCPSVVVAYAMDQLLWGAILKRSGIAPKTLFRRKLTAKTLARAIQTVLRTPSMKAKAETIGAAMRREDGVAQAVELIERCCV